MMDIPPVYYLYKYHKNDDYEKTIEITSYYFNRIKLIYLKLKDDLFHLEKSINSKFFLAYKEWFEFSKQMIRRSFENEERNYDEVEQKLNEIISLSEDDELQNIIWHNFMIFKQRFSLRHDNNGLSIFSYWMAKKVNDFIFKQNENHVNLLPFLEKSTLFRKLLTKTTITSIANSVQNAIKNIINHIPKLKSPESLFYDLNRLLNELYPDYSLLERYQNDREGCFAIAVNSTWNIAYALSGSRDFEPALENVFIEIESKLFNNNCVRCCVTGEMLFYIPPFYTPIKLRDDQAYKPNHYSCCERKILANIKENDNTFFVRWAPCEKCCPALLNRYEKIFAYNENFKESKIHKRTKVQEYRIHLKNMFVSEKA
ncbi:hypothetical protein [Fibrobacter sp. UWB4]|uniref:hypothetical protein n=1 Tax=Fibrobacter sp. UWB4 TaxID=1964356 RepID=UPI0011303E89|nr:hypothetical protein [Fibrobacter sp. UWB4]